MEQYKELLNTILEKGSYKEPAREGMPGTTSLFGYQFRHDLSKGFPLLTTKPVWWKGVVVELMWFLKGDTNIKYLDENGVRKLWHQDAYNYYLKMYKKHTTLNEWQKENNIKMDTKLLSFDDFNKAIKEDEREFLPSFGAFKVPGINYSEDHEEYNYTLGDCGRQYGKQWREFGSFEVPFADPKASPGLGVDQILALINSLKSQPYGRRHLLTAINPCDESNVALFWCHALAQFNCRKLSLDDRCALIKETVSVEYSMNPSDENYGNLPQRIEETLDLKGIPKYYLDCQLYQRSADVVLGVPFNIASYALLTHIIAKICNMVPGEFIHTFGDVHIYDNHKDAVIEQLQRDVLPLPTLELSGVDHQIEHLDKIGLDTLFDYLSRHLELFKLEGYTPHPKLDSETELSTGLKK